VAALKERSIKQQGERGGKGKGGKGKGKKRYSRDPRELLLKTRHQWRAANSFFLIEGQPAGKRDHRTDFEKYLKSSLISENPEGEGKPGTKANKGRAETANKDPLFIQDFS